MKYVMFTHKKSGVRVPVFGSELLSHCDLHAGKEWVPTSAGFCAVGSPCYGESKSMGLVPAKGDTDICNVVVAGLESMMFLSQDLDENRRQLSAIQRPQPPKPVRSGPGRAKP